MNKVFSSILSVIALFGVCFSNGNFAKATDGPEAEQAAEARVSSAAAEEAEPAAARDTEIVFLMDTSSSMRFFREIAVKKFNDVIDKQKRLVGHGKAFVTAIAFDHRYRKIFNKEDIQTLRGLTLDDYELGIGTAMMSAVKKTINELLLDNGIMGRKVIFIIITDGEDNLSNVSPTFLERLKKYGVERSMDPCSEKECRELIQKKKEDGWQFRLFGTNFNVEKVGKKLGFGERERVLYESSAAGYASVYGNIDAIVSKARQD